jgi:hypothetical protein
MAAIRENDERNVEDAVLKLASTRSIFARRQEQVSGINAVQQAAVSCLSVTAAHMSAVSSPPVRRCQA